MNKILLGAVMLMGTLTFASTGIEKTEHETTLSKMSFTYNGWCEIRIYKGDKLIAYSYEPASSEGACELRARAMLLKAQFESTTLN